MEAYADILTPALEDYLEAILRISIEKGVVRVKDISKLLKVKPSSAVGSIKTLSEKNLVDHKRYGYIKLTDKGLVRAGKIYEKHKLLAKFFNQIIGLDPKTSATDACSIEHYISKKTMDKLLKFTEFIEKCPEGKPIWLSNFHYYAKHGKMPNHCLEAEKGGKMEDLKNLNSLKIGDSGIVRKLTTEPSVKRRIMDMGIVPGVKIKVEKAAPMGDPVDIVLRGYHLTLRKDEASGIFLEKLN